MVAQYFIIEPHHYQTFRSEEEAIAEAREMGSTGLLVKALAEVEFVNPAPIFTVTKLED